MPKSARLKYRSSVWLILALDGDQTTKWRTYSCPDIRWLMTSIVLIKCMSTPVYMSFFNKSNTLAKLNSRVTPQLYYFQICPVRSAQQKMLSKLCTLAQHHTITDGGQLHTPRAERKVGDMPVASTETMEHAHVKNCWRRAAQLRCHSCWRWPQGSYLEIVLMRGHTRN
jgi:hypothetical protein